MDKVINWVNPRTGESWISPVPENRKVVDGATFIQVQKPGSSRTFWINESALKRKQGNLSKKV